MLDGGKADLTIGVPPTPAGRILNARLFDERFVCIMRKDHPSAGSDLDLESFLSLSHLLVSPENERFGVVDVALTKMEIGRASCRESVCQSVLFSVVAVSLKKKNKQN